MQNTNNQSAQIVSSMYEELKTPEQQPPVVAHRMCIIWRAQENEKIKMKNLHKGNKDYSLIGK
jgi:hypothetical protein